MGTRGTCPPTSDGGDIICNVPPTFFSRFCIWRGFKNESDVCHVLCEKHFINDASVYNVRKLDFQANLCEAFAEDEKQHYCVDWSFGMGSLAKDCFQPLVNRISIKTLEK